MACVCKDFWNFLKDDIIVLKSTARNMYPSNMEERRIVIVGNANVGKSALVTKWTQNRTSNKDNPSNKVFFKPAVIDDRRVLLDILDIGRDHMRMLMKYCRDAVGFLIVYSITDRGSFQNIIEWRDLVIRLKGGPDYLGPMVLVGSKVDQKEERKVEETEGKRFADGSGMAFFEVSAFTGENVQECFDAVIKLANVFLNPKKKREFYNDVQKKRNLRIYYSVHQ
eukprot:Phypoly_transcript_19276.p1 GENE.Phypoly_transcript_19276~~Phypoly_transcript_19276.p1  ORF type:complete len:233 (+),score=41.73 Phypoly_transcript_19276:29-700(+)